ncbi:hypothetical protein [Micromonospora sp. NPDC005806]|uniref:hypothetical protein n=1 Tax=Micromonospora sp. NPDC005806 TaxID=3364234 RepID=UPI0036771503
MPDGLGPLLCFLFLLGVWSSVISALLGHLNQWEAMPGTSPWRFWAPGILAWSWPLLLVASVLTAIISPNIGALGFVALAPVTLLTATALIVVELRRRRAEDLMAQTPRRLKD